MTTSVLILNCDRYDALAQLCARVAQEDLDEVIVSENSTTPEEITRVRRLCRDYGYHCIAAPHKPFRMASMRNRAIEAATGDVLIFLDSDILPESPDYFKRIADYHATQRGLLIHGRYKETDGTDLDVADDGTMSIRDPFRERTLNQGRRPWRIAASGCCSIRRDVLGDTRFDPSFDGAWGWEDQDFTRQLWDRGVPVVYDPLIVGTHMEHPKSQEGCGTNWKRFRQKWNSITLQRYIDGCRELGIEPRPAAVTVSRFIDFDFDQPVHDCLKVLDVGAGDGMIAHYLSCMYGVEVTALEPYTQKGHRPRAQEINERMLEITRDAVRIERSDLASFRGPDHYDVALATNTLHHLVPTRDYLDESSEAWGPLVANLQNLWLHMKHGGRFFATDVLPLDERNPYYHVAAGRGVGFATKHTPEEWSAVMEAAGFEVTRVRHLINREMVECSTDEAIREGYKYTIEARRP